MRVRLLAAAIFVALTVPHAATAQKVPTPASVIGFEPGTDRKLPQWRQVVDYFKALDAASPRVQLRVLGKTTLGRPFIAAFIGDEATIANLGKVKDVQRKLADPRLTTPAERAALERDAKVVVLVTSSIHSTEVGGILTPLNLAYKLATSEDP
ncbi:MAG: M14 family zinc carboxypeptidase, partial [Gemmatimonadaceae bacterium]